MKTKILRETLKVTPGERLTIEIIDKEAIEETHLIYDVLAYIRESQATPLTVFKPPCDFLEEIRKTMKMPPPFVPAEIVLTKEEFLNQLRELKAKEDLASIVTNIESFDWVDLHQMNDEELQKKLSSMPFTIAHITISTPLGNRYLTFKIKE